MISANLKSDIDTIKRKRILKELKISKDLLQVFKNDLEGVDYSKTNLSDLDKFENEKDVSVNIENVKAALEKLVITKRRLTSENDLEKFITDQLAIIFGKENVNRQYSVGGFLALKTDIDIGNGQIGIELKILDNLSASDSQRMIGQVVYYKKRFYNNNLLVYIASRSTISPTAKELKDFIEKLRTTVIFNTTLNL